VIYILYAYLLGDAINLFYRSYYSKSILCAYNEKPIEVNETLDKTSW
jgi:hypothetical protein